MDISTTEDLDMIHSEDSNPNLKSNRTKQVK